MAGVIEAGIKTASTSPMFSWSSPIPIINKMLPFRQGLLCGLGFVFLIQNAASQNWDGPSPYADGFAPDVILSDDWKSSFPDFEGIDTNYPTLIAGGDGDNATEDVSHLAPRAAKDFYLRIMPLGASIVEGMKSSDGNGFRKLLRQQLRWKGWKVNMVGTKNNGDMKDNVRRLLLSSCARLMTEPRTMKDILVGGSMRCITSGKKPRPTD
jgi:hypothetical protein